MSDPRPPTVVDYAAWERGYMPPHLCPMQNLPPFPDNGSHGNDAIEHIARLISRGTSDDPGCERKTPMEIANEVARFVSRFGARAQSPPGSPSSQTDTALEGQ